MEWQLNVFLKVGVQAILDNFCLTKRQPAVDSIVPLEDAHLWICQRQSVHVFELSTGYGQ